MLLLCLLIIQAIEEQDIRASSTCIVNSKMISEMKICGSYFHSTTLFSDLSRNLTSSSDLFEGNSSNTQLQDNIESQDNVETNTEVNGFQEEDALDTNQTALPSTSSDLFEGNNENVQPQGNVENNNTDIGQQDETITELQLNDDNNTMFG
jgi:hypothetical protein